MWQLYCHLFEFLLFTLASKPSEANNLSKTQQAMLAYGGSKKNANPNLGATFICHCQLHENNTDFED